MFMPKLYRHFIPWCRAATNKWPSTL